ncbi:MAG: DUF3524 domain-containing protein [Bacteroidota bacterium]
MEKMNRKIVLLEPFLTGSHQQWATQMQRFSRHDIEILSLPGRHWKWRMHGAAVTLANAFQRLSHRPDLIIATDMLDLSTFLGLTKQQTSTIPVAIYFHENQLTYPWSPTDPDTTLRRNNQYSFINYTSALAADAVLFNSAFHKASFLSALEAFLRRFPDFKNLETIDLIRQKSEVLPLGLNLTELQQTNPSRSEHPGTVLWNHRWEYDKNPDAFFEALQQLQDEQIDFRLIVVGKSYNKQPKIFEQIPQLFERELLHFGYAKSRAEYRRLLWQADILPVTSKQDFFGISVVEAIFCNCFPILPKRLAYEEHIPEPHQSKHFYDQDGDFYPFLKRSLERIDTIRNQTYQTYVEHYDWSSMIEHYDQLWETIINS